MDLNQDAAQNAICENCKFAENCGGWKHSPYCVDSAVKKCLEDTSALPWVKVTERSPVETQTSSTLFEFVYEASIFFSGLGYSCDAAEVFLFISKMKKDLDIEKLLKILFVHGYSESKKFANDYTLFTKIFFDKKRELRRVVDRRRKLEKSHEERKNKLGSELDKLKKRQETLDKEKKNDSEIKKAEKLEREQSKIAGLGACMSDSRDLREFVSVIMSGRYPGHAEIMQQLKDVAKKACVRKNYKEIMEAAKKRVSMLEKMASRNKLEDQYFNNRRQIEVTESKIRWEEENFRKNMEQLVKESSYGHREEFIHPRNAVRSLSTGEIIPDTKFGKMTDAEKRKVMEYIQDNVQKFRTRLTRKVRTSERKKICLPDTIKKACATGGIPMRLVYQKPVHQKTRLILFLDVSGSCKDASELMLIFMHSLKEVFPGGCLTYAFTNTLYDITSFFETDDTGESAKRILNKIPRAGAYSNYERPFRQFYEKHMSEVTGDSFVYFIGDARNNKNASGAEYIKAIARRAKKSFWLNTEPMEKWNTGDSIISEYAKYVTEVVETETPSQLLGFIQK